MSPSSTCARRLCPGYNRSNPLRAELPAAAVIDARILEAWASHPRRFASTRRRCFSTSQGPCGHGGDAHLHNDCVTVDQRNLDALTRVQSRES